MKTKNWMNQDNSKQEEKVTKVEVNNNVCGRTYNEETSFSQVNFQTFQEILDKRNELLSSVKRS